MSAVVDTLVVYRILRLFAQKIEDMDAYKLGVIDADGKKLKNPSTGEERASYTLLTRFVLKVKKALTRSPDMNAKRLLTFAAAVAILREHGEKIEEDELEVLLEVYANDEDIVKEAELLQESNLFSFRNFLLDDVAANAVGGGAIHGVGVGPKGEPGKPVKKKKKNDGDYQEYPILIPMARRINQKIAEQRQRRTRV